MYQKRFSGKPSRFSSARPAHGGARPAHGASRPHGNSPSGRRPFNNRRKANFNTGEYIDPARFINKAVITEEVEHFVPEHQFGDFAITDALKRAVAAKGYVAPTPIQDRAIPHVLAGKDVVGIANTGTGKTAAFLIPLINKVLTDATAQVLIVVPTRELAIQIDEELKGFTKGMKLFSVVCVGGASIVPQIRALRYRNQFVIGTPGRLKDLIEQKKINLAHYSTIVLDEADRMLDMGFINDMRFLMAGMPSPRHTLFFSATLSREIEALISQFLHEPVRISVKTGDTSKNVD
ncbi:MAG TPA: DEAD/DEAH box helicase, partial [Candidatus Paceibacterota bacterium]|nr:DEAD/DEAH box helicase [Candidatus Paceibacterota bacterium]